MAKSRINWFDVHRGDIITFNYNKKQRIVLVLERVKRTKADGTKSDLLHAIQLKSGNKNFMTEQILLKMTTTLGRVFVVKEDEFDNKYYKIELGDYKWASKDAYERVSALVNDKDAYRTFDYKKLKTLSVFRESYNELEILMD